MIRGFCFRRERSFHVVPVRQLRHLLDRHRGRDEDVIQRVDERLVILDSRVVRKVGFCAERNLVRRSHRVPQRGVPCFPFRRHRCGGVRAGYVPGGDQVVPAVPGLQVEVAHQHVWKVAGHALRVRRGELRVNGHHPGVAEHARHVIVRHPEFHATCFALQGRVHDRVESVTCELPVRLRRALPRDFLHPGCDELFHAARFGFARQLLRVATPRDVHLRHVVRPERHGEGDAHVPVERLAVQRAHQVVSALGEKHVQPPRPLLRHFL
mmetsp:Transcript_220/g.806  ORF Transcript_220/g.806 Transcript_220/m.806 type:complete len:267 (+) Transcript_220:1284-2084(+)